MTLADISILVLILLFAGTALKGFNLGLGAFAAAFGVSVLAGIDVEKVIEAFPGDFFIMIVGVTALFGVAHLNGTLDWMLDGILRLVRSNATLASIFHGVARARDSRAAERIRF
ncbi:hypothetical protein ACPUD8_16800 [Brevibacterium sp. FAM 25378]|uniref:hypothetical protein n=1 Tax=unclassified Brevibacterium TaxID=2614124 RepID=UPI001091EB1D|nr:hypothetical protein [Brevibacterium sp. S22]TGD30766.1 hypothetical protein EB835_11445 [Brevibacterium sp. S22]